MENRFLIAKKETNSKFNESFKQHFSQCCYISNVDTEKHDEQ